MTSTASASARAALIGMALGAGSYGVFSFADAVVKEITSHGVGVAQALAFGTWFAFLPLAAFAWASGDGRSIRLTQPLRAVVRAVFVTTAAAAVLWAFTRLPMTDGYALVFASPLIVTALSVPVLGERVGPWRWGAVLAGFVGVLVMLRPGFQTLDPGHLAALISAACWAGGILVLRGMRPDNSPVALVGVLLITTLTLLWPIAILTWVPAPPALFALMAVSGFLAGVAHILLVLAFRRAPAAVVAPFQYTQMIWAAIFGAVWFNDPLDPFIAVGASIVVGAGLVILWRESRPTLPAAAAADRP
jgi:S-adenosylmethionine uptake transporter